MDKVNEFEHGIDNEPNTVTAHLPAFTKKQREPFRYPSLDQLLDNPGHLKAIIERFFNEQVPRLRILESYDLAENEGITNATRRLTENRPDNRAKHNFGGYIASMQNAYLFGKPVRVEHQDKDISEFLSEYAEINDVESLNSALGYDCSRFGRAYELHWRNDQDEDKTALSSVFETFVIYDTSVEGKALCAVRCPVVQVGDKEELHLTLYTDDRIIKYKPTKREDIQLREESSKQHDYNGIPVIEWRNNRERIGDYEKVLTLIDLYDAAQSDTANYMQEINDALLLITGDVDTTERSTKEMAEMLKAGLMMLESGKDLDGRPTKVDAQYLYKQYDVMGKEAYNKRLERDIHKFTHTPDLTDENFAGTQSGVAIKYKLFGLEQTRSIKERFYTKAIRRRYQLISNLHKSISEVDLDYRNLNIIFTENLPEDVWAEVKSFYDVGGDISQRSLLDLLSFIKSSEEELKRIKEERPVVPDEFYDKDRA